LGSYFAEELLPGKNYHVYPSQDGVRNPAQCFFCLNRSSSTAAHELPVLISPNQSGETGSEAA
jgi:hypothetical protein